VRRFLQAELERAGRRGHGDGVPGRESRARLTPGVLRVRRVAPRPDRPRAAVAR
jgi:hypothetical protein